MSLIHFSILDKTLCGAGDEPIEESQAETAEFCDDCVQAMWQEQYRRSVLNKPEKKPKKAKKTEAITEPVVVTAERVYVPPKPMKSLRHYLRSVA